MTEVLLKVSPRSRECFQLLETPRLPRVDIEAVIAALGGRYDPAEAAIAERMLREHAGTIPGAQLVEEIGLASAAHRRQR